MPPRARPKARERRKETQKIFIAETTGGAAATSRRTTRTNAGKPPERFGYAQKDELRNRPEEKEKAKVPSKRAVVQTALTSTRKRSSAQSELIKKAKKASTKKSVGRATGTGTRASPKNQRPRSASQPVEPRTEERQERETRETPLKQQDNQTSGIHR